MMLPHHCEKVVRGPKVEEYCRHEATQERCLIATSQRRLTNFAGSQMTFINGKTSLPGNRFNFIRISLLFLTFKSCIHHNLDLFSSNLYLGTSHIFIVFMNSERTIYSVLYETFILSKGIKQFLESYSITNVWSVQTLSLP